MGKKINSDGDRRFSLMGNKGELLKGCELYFPKRNAWHETALCVFKQAASSPRNFLPKVFP
jgi:hypothetical protein